MRKRQQKLADLGFSPGKIDGKWGRKSRTALLAAQQALGLEVDGVWGPVTEAAIDKALRDGLPKDSPVDRPKPPPKPKRRPTLDPKNPRARIMARQRALIDLGYDPGPVDGKWGPKSKTALSLFQRDIGIKVDAEWSNNTARAVRRALKTSWKRPARRKRPKRAKRPLNTSGPSARDRERQKLLTRLGFRPGPADGIFGAKSIAALRAAQKKFGLPQDGVWTPKVDRTLRGALLAVQAKEGKKLDPDQYNTAQKSDRDLIRQKALKRLGFDPGVPDGMWGPKSEAALKSAQRALGITPDGRWGPNTEKAVQAALRAGWTLQMGPPKKGGKNPKTRPLDTIRQRQQALRELGAYAGAIDGSWGGQSRRALKKTQRQLGLTADGRWGPKSEAAIRQALAKGIQIGEDWLVEVLDLETVSGRQEALQDLGAPVELTGVWDAQSVKALKDAQLALGLEATGDWSDELMVRLEAALADLEVGEGSDRPDFSREVPSTRSAGDRPPARKSRTKAEALAAERRNAAIAVTDRPAWIDQDRPKNGRQEGENEKDWLARWTFWASYPSGPSDPTSDQADERCKAAHRRIVAYIDRMWPFIRRISPSNPIAPQLGTKSRAASNWHKWALAMESSSRLRDPEKLAEYYEKAWKFMFKTKRGQEWTAALTHGKLNGIPVTTAGLVALAADAFAASDAKNPTDKMKSLNAALNILSEPKPNSAFLTANLIHA